MKRRKLMLMLLLLTIVVITVIILNNKKSISKENQNYIEKKAEDLSPISKESAKKILQAEYGIDVSNTEDDFKLEGEYYIVDVYISLESDEEHDHTEEESENSNKEEFATDSNESEVHVHNISLGKHKIDIYTGELTKN